MRRRRESGWAAALAVLSISGCHNGKVSPQETAARTVFTDSLLHAEHCALVKRGEDWRRVCTPLDQSAPRPIRNRP